MDLNAACAGYVFALDIAQKYLECGDCKTVLIVSSEIVTRWLIIQIGAPVCCLATGRLRQ